ncbi:unnamed protein product [Cuscuta europaea]|uniref:Uncharacterized protein n=2 Tax=Cuscuta europaea TaxID=41803 RepID=A0A9P1ELK8_CUSEU|nr:unnamed protein product [Cuscuta europaea]
MVNVKGLARLKKQDPKGSGQGSQKPATALFKKAEGDAAAGKRKSATKGSPPPPATKKQKKGDVAKKEPPVIIADEHPASGVHVEKPSGKTPAGAEELLPEVLQVSFPRGTSLASGAVDPGAILRGITPETDRASLGAYNDAALEDHILRSSLSACLALGEHARRLQEWRLHKAEQDAKMKECILKNKEAVKLGARLEEELRQMELRLEAAEKGKADAEAAAEEARRAAKEAEDSKALAVAKAREEAVDAFVAEGWRAEGRKVWLSSVVEAYVEEWAEGPGWEWMARKGREYYEAGEFFTQALIYRRMARHLGIEQKDFSPSAYGLPPLQPDVRESLPEGVQRPDLEDTELKNEAEDDAVEAGAEASSRPAAEGTPVNDAVVVVE